MDAALRSLMVHTIGIEPWGSADAWNNVTYGALISYKGRIQNKRRMVRSLTGEQVVSETTVYLDTTTDIDPRSRMTLPSGYLIRQPAIIQVARLEDEYGWYATRIYA